MFALRARDDVPADLDAALKMQEETIVAWDKRYPSRGHWKQFEAALQACSDSGGGLFGG